MGRKTKQNKLTSPILVEQVNRDNLDLMDDFLVYLRSTQHSEGTIAGYKSDLLIFWVWCLNNCGNKHFTDLTKRDIVKFQDWLINSNENSPARVRRIKSSLSSLSNYVSDILDDEFKDFRPIINKIKNPINKPVREKTVWADEELTTLLDELMKLGQYKKACALALGMYSGRRKAELPRFKKRYFDPENVIFGSLYKTPEPILTKGMGGGKMLFCYTLKNSFQPYLDIWLTEMDRLGIDSEWLFPDENDPSKPIAISTMNSWADTFSKMTGKDFYWHSLRHRYVTALSKSGLPDDAIQKIIGWNSIELVSVYKDIDAEDEFGKYFSNGEIVAQPKVGLEDL